MAHGVWGLADILRSCTLLETFQRQIVCHKCSIPLLNPLLSPLPKGALQAVAHLEHVKLFKVKYSDRKKWHTEPV